MLLGRETRPHPEERANGSARSARPDDRLRCTSRRMAAAGALLGLLICTTPAQAQFADTILLNGKIVVYEIINGKKEVLPPWDNPYRQMKT